MNDSPSRPVRYGANPSKLRETAVELAIKAELGTTPERLVRNAAAIHRYLAHGITRPADVVQSVDHLVTPFLDEYEFYGDGGNHVPTDMERALIEDALHTFVGQHWPADAPPAPAPAPFPHPYLLPPDLVRALVTQYDTALYVLQLVAEERSKQRYKGWTRDVDDTRTDGELAVEAAYAISPDQAASPLALGWVDITQPRLAVLVQGIALAVAEAERLIRSAGTREAAAWDKIAAGMASGAVAAAERSHLDLGTGNDMTATATFRMGGSAGTDTFTAGVMPDAERTHGADSAIDDEAPPPVGRPAGVEAEPPLPGEDPTPIKLEAKPVGAVKADEA